MRIFTGFDSRESVGWFVFLQSLIETSTGWVLHPPLHGHQRDGTNAFTYERFRIPELCGWSGMALWADGADMLLRANISDLAALYDPTKAVQVVKHDYKTKHPRKYVGTEMEAVNQDYERKNWSSLILWNCGHWSNYENQDAIREAVETGNGRFLHRFSWLSDDEVGELPAEWNWLADEYGENPKAKLLHWTAGMPGFKNYANAPMSAHWHETAKTLHSER